MKFLRFSRYLSLIVVQFFIFAHFTSSHKIIEYNFPHDLCRSSDKKYVIPQRLNDEFPVIVINTNKKTQTSWTKPPFDHCDFEVKAQNERNGIFAVIQNLSFRNGTHGTCLDSVMFERKDYTEYKYCGEFNRQEHTKNSTDSRFYGEHSIGVIRTLISISNERLNPDFQLNLKIVYTIYKGCDGTDPLRFKQVVADQNICIAKELFCDRVFNCGGMEHCLDENCQQPITIVSDETGTKVTFAVVTTIFHCFVIFIFCLWICRRQRKLCWSSDCAGPSPELDTPALALEPEQRPPGPPVSTAPMLEEVLPLGLQDKDLPPSYDSLFPEHANP